MYVENGQKGRTREEDTGDLAEHSEEDEETTAETARGAVRAPGNRDHAVVLREDRERRDREQRRDEAADAVALLVKRGTRVSLAIGLRKGGEGD